MGAVGVFLEFLFCFVLLIALIAVVVVLLDDNHCPRK